MKGTQILVVTACLMLFAVTGIKSQTGNTLDGHDRKGIENELRSNIDPNYVFPKIQDALAIVTTPRGVGSGFIVDLDGKKYLVTNEHVSRGGYPVTAKLLSGRDLQLGTLQAANTLDLIRFEVTNNLPACLEIRADGPIIGLPVAIFGNSDGAGVVTSMAGKVLGVGPDRLEVDAPFVEGNSGSPIVDSQGKVLGVATYAFLLNDPRNWLKSGTRYNEVRRMGLRLVNIQWVTMTPQQYFARADILADLETCRTDIYTCRENYSFDQNKKKYRRSLNLCLAIARIVEAYNQKAAANGKMHRVDVDRYRRTDKRSGQMENDAARTYFMADAQNNQKSIEHKKACKDFCQTIIDTTKGEWMTEHFKTEANEYVRFAESMKSALQ